MILWSASNAYDIGSAYETASSTGAISSRGANRPQSRSWGKMNAGMNWITWNSVRANALASRPIAIPSSALAIASATTAIVEPAASTPSTANATIAVAVACTAATRANAIPYPSSRSSLASGSVISRSSVPVVRSRSIVIDVIRNIMISGKSPTIGPPSDSNDPGEPSSTPLSSAIRAAGTTRIIATVRGSRRNWRSTRSAVARVIRGLIVSAPARSA